MVSTANSLCITGASSTRQLINADIHLRYQKHSASHLRFWMHSNVVRSDSKTSPSVDILIGRHRNSVQAIRQTRIDISAKHPTNRAPSPSSNPRAYPLDLSCLHTEFSHDELSNQL